MRFQVFRDWNPRPIAFLQVLVGSSQNATWIQHGDDFGIQSSVATHVSNRCRVRPRQHFGISQVFQGSASPPTVQSRTGFKQVHMGGACRHEASGAIEGDVWNVRTNVDSVASFVARYRGDGLSRARLMDDQRGLALIRRRPSKAMGMTGMDEPCLICLPVLGSRLTTVEENTCQAQPS